MKTAILFPGQGSQCPGMGQDVADASRDAMDLWKKAEGISNLPLREIFWDGDPAQMADTRVLQPALTVVNLTLWSQLAPRISPAAFAGHSLGEYAALAAAGAITPEEALHIVTLRGRLMAEADPDGIGAMTAVLKLPQETVTQLVETTRAQTGEVIIIANYNTPEQFVVSGTKAAIAHLQTLLAEHKGRNIPLSVSGAFHSPLMQTAAEALRQALRKVTFRRTRVPVYCNVHGKGVCDGESLYDSIQLQMTSSVQWITTMRQQWQDGVRCFVEVGPKTTLTKMVAPCLKGIAASADEIQVHSVTTAEQIANL